MMLNRRQLLASSFAAIPALSPACAAMAAATSPATRKFTIDLRCGAIGVRADQAKAIELGARHGFESVDMDARGLSRMSDTTISELTSRLKSKGLVWGSAGLPVEFRRDESRFKNDLGSLPERAAAVAAAGGARMGTWIMPCHDDLTFMANMKLHSTRLREVANILADHGLRFGLEYVGPKTLWTSQRYSFIHSMSGGKDLIAEIDRPNVGFILDSWHWYTAGETVDDLKTLTNDDIVACDLNDAPKGLAIDEQIDQQRELPMATGVIDIKAFLSTLVELGYDGPIRAEPFNQALNRMDNDEATAATAAAMKKAFALIDAG